MCHKLFGSVELTWDSEASDVSSLAGTITSLSLKRNESWCRLGLEGSTRRSLRFEGLGLEGSTRRSLRFEGLGLEGSTRQSLRFEGLGLEGSTRRSLRFEGLGLEGSTRQSLRFRGDERTRLSMAFEGAFAVPRQRQPPKDAAPELRHSCCLLLQFLRLSIFQKRT